MVGEQFELFTLKKGDFVYISRTTTLSPQQWGYGNSQDDPTKRGWVLLSDLEISNLTPEEEATQDRNNQISDNFQDSGLDQEMVNVLVEDAIGNSARFDANTRLFGQPFQFSSKTDLRITTNELDLGRKYTETFIAEAPIVSILPGSSNFLPSMTDKEKSEILNWFKDAGQGATANNKAYLEEILAGESRYFDFMSDYTSYMKYVNLMCRTSAVYMGIGDMKLPIENILFNKYKHFDWKNYKYTSIQAKNTEGGEDSLWEKAKDLKDQVTWENMVNEVVESTAGAKNYVQFYVDPATSFQESSSNQTAQSSLGSMMETAQGYSKEVHFYGGLADGTFLDNITGAASSAASGIGGVAGMVTNAFSGGLLTKLFGATKTIIDGGNVLLPEIWGDSNYQKSYSINVNLISPYGTKESVYLHVLVPLFHLMSLALPRQITANGFAHPFMVRVSAKGWFNCEMGMVDSISIEKVQGSYTVNGIPTEIKVSISIRDLYSDLMMTPVTKPGLFFANRGLSNWLAVTSGVDVSKPALMEKWEGILNTLVGSALNVTDVYSVVQERLRNIWTPLVDF